MGDHILYISGTAFPNEPAKMAREEQRARSICAQLEAAGHQVTKIGTKWRGFYMRHVEEFLQQHPEVKLIIINAHGNAKDEKHLVAARKEKASNIYADDLYKRFAAAAGDRPLHIFDFSCGSKFGCEAALQNLPVGSVLFEASQLKDIFSYMLNKDHFKHLPNVTGAAAAEHFMFNILANGYDTETPYHPRLTLCTSDRYRGNILDLWDVGLTNSMDDENDVFSAEFEAEAKAHLSSYFGEEKLNAAFRSIELYIKAARETVTNKVKTENTPIEITLKMDNDRFLKDVRKAGLLGPICAIGVFANKDLLTAFREDALIFSTEPAPGAVIISNFDDKGLSQLGL